MLLSFMLVFNIYRGGSFYLLFFSTHNYFTKTENKTHKNTLRRIWTANPWSGKQRWRPLDHYYYLFNELFWSCEWIHVKCHCLLFATNNLKIIIMIWIRLKQVTKIFLIQKTLFLMTFINYEVKSFLALSWKKFIVFII